MATINQELREALLETAEAHLKRTNPDKPSDAEEHLKRALSAMQRADNIAPQFENLSLEENQELATLHEEKYGELAFFPDRDKFGDLEEEPLVDIEKDRRYNELIKKGLGN